MEDIQGMPATLLGLALRFFQFFFAAVSLSVMASTNDFPSVSAFCHLVAATGLQSLSSLALATVDVYAIMVKRSLQNRRLVSLFAVGDGVTSTMTFAAACASAGITVLIDNDLNSCSANHCVQFETSTALAFISWFARLNTRSVPTRVHIVTGFFFLLIWSLYLTFFKNPVLGNHCSFCCRNTDQETYYAKWLQS
ncbi:CASP-like protein 5A2 isoform X2 [Brassica napus]|nr:CASP-like protein 5A2 isoform X2 [Brassica napus]